LISHGERSKDEFEGETKEQKGKDVMINWDFQDSFDTDNKLWIDANGLFMHQKELWKRQDFVFKKDNKIAGNFYPVQSAIAIQDKNSDK
jgi:hypothetical protein